MKESRKEFIKKAHSAACSEWKENIEKEFPKLFKEDALVVGKWYINIDGLKCLHFVTKITDSKEYFAYGFSFSNEWKNNKGFGSVNDYTNKNFRPATDKEVEEALIKEAKKRGFKEGVRIKSKWMTNISANNLNGKFVFDNKFELCAEANRLMKYTIFEKGVWAEIIKETITKEQAEKELGKTILN